MGERERERTKKREKERLREREWERGRGAARCARRSRTDFVAFKFLSFVVVLSVADIVVVVVVVVADRFCRRRRRQKIKFSKLKRKITFLQSKVKRCSLARANVQSAQRSTFIFHFWIQTFEQENVPSFQFGYMTQQASTTSTCFIEFRILKSQVESHCKDTGGPNRLCKR